MYFRPLIRKGGVCLLGLACLAFAADRPASKTQAKGGKKPAARSVARPSATPGGPAQAGAVVVKDWESGPNALRAARPGDFPAPLDSPPAVGTAAVQRTIDGGIEYTGGGLMTTMTVHRDSAGNPVFGCNQSGDHSGHDQAATGRAKAEEK